MALKYKFVTDALLEELSNGKFKEGDKFYSESELKNRFQVSSATVIKAIKDLVNRGILVRQQGKGTFVSKARQGQPVRFFDHEKYNVEDEKVKVHAIQKGNDPRILKELQLGSDDIYYEIIRIREVDNEPIYIQHTYLVPSFFKTIALKKPDYYLSVYEKIRSDFDIDLFHAEMDETTEICFPAPKLEKDLMHLVHDEPVVNVKRHSYIRNHEIVEYVESFKKWNYFKIEIKTI